MTQSSSIAPSRYKYSPLIGAEASAFHHTSKNQHLQIWTPNLSSKIVKGPQKDSNFTSSVSSILLQLVFDITDLPTPCSVVGLTLKRPRVTAEDPDLVSGLPEYRRRLQDWEPLANHDYFDNCKHPKHSSNRNLVMDDSACDGEARGQHESIWVWIKPAAFYNQLESRFKTNRYLLRRNLSYWRPPIKPQKKSGASVEFRVADLVNTMSGQHLGGGLSSSGTTQKQVSKLSVFVVICEQLSEQEFNPFFVKLVHLKSHETVSFEFDLEDLDPQLLTVLLLVRDGLNDMSILHKDKTISISSDLTKKACFGFLPVGTMVWWYAHALRLTSSKIRVHKWESGTLTIGEKNIWNGLQNRNFKMLSLEPCTSPNLAPACFSLQKSIRRGTNATTKTKIQHQDKEDEVAFRFVFDRVHPQCVEQRTERFGCPFCPMHCKSLLGLRYHLTASHDLFIYELETREITLIWVKRRMDVFETNGDIFCPHTRRLIDPIEKVFYMNRAAFLKSKPVIRKRKTENWNRQLDFDEKLRPNSSRRRLNQPMTRLSTRVQNMPTSTRQGSPQSLLDSTGLFYHSRTALPMTEDEIKNGPDTEDEVDEEAWEIKTRRDLTQIPGASKSNVEFMFLWDEFLHKSVFPYSDFKVPTACKLFAIKLRRRGLMKGSNYQQFLHHLHALFLFKLIQQDDVDMCIEILKIKELPEGLLKQVPKMERELFSGQSKPNLKA